MNFKALIYTAVITATLAPFSLSAMQGKRSLEELQREYREVVETSSQFKDLTSEQKEKLVRKCAKAEFAPKIYNGKGNL